MQNCRRTVLALDFDGVLCDSARETALSAWRAGREFWPEWEGVPPEAYLARFSHLRPWLETGYEAIMIMRLIADAMPDEEVTLRLEQHCRDLLARLGMRRDDLVAIFGRARDEWIREDVSGWLSSHRFYSGVMAALQRVVAGSDVYVLTTKQERFARLLLASQGVDLPEERIWGLGRGRPKESDLAELEAAAGDGVVHFVEDRAETLRRVMGAPGLERVRLYYASWGYGTPADLLWARRERRIRVWALDEFLQLG